jgi:hypothetical protein
MSDHGKAVPGRSVLVVGSGFGTITDLADQLFARVSSVVEVAIHAPFVKLVPCGAVFTTSVL